MSTREQFEKWCRAEYGCTDFSYEQHNYKFYCYNDEFVSALWTGYEAATEANNAEVLALQARCKELSKVSAEQLATMRAALKHLDKGNSSVVADLLRTHSDQALQRALLEARIDEHIVMRTAHAHTVAAAREEELRAQLKGVDEQRNGG